MILIFDSRVYEGQSPHSDLVKIELENLGHSVYVVSPHNLEDGQISVKQIGSNVIVEIEEHKIDIDLVWMSSRWRSDCIIDTPSDELYPSSFRMRIEQFLQDIRFASYDSIWCPGQIELIERSESKPVVLSQACKIGLDTPLFTIDAFSGLNSLPKTGSIYRKQLGHPFTISLQVEKGHEVGITTTNIEVGLSQIIDDHQPWQWQEVLYSTAQIRCCVVDKRVWSAIWKRPKEIGLTDFRYLNESDEGKNIIWEEHKLPLQITEKLLALLNAMRIHNASPEFLLTEDGRYVLIDLNPRGDWYGFFTETEHREISQEFANFFDKAIRKV